MKSLSNISTIGQYVNEFSLALADKVKSQCDALHDPALHKPHPRLVNIKAKPFQKQADCVSACVKALKTDRLAINAGMMGTGKTMMAVSTVHCHSEGRPYLAWVMCPSHLTKKWRDEIAKFITAKVVIVKDWKHFIELCSQGKPAEPTWWVIAQTTAKLGYSRRCAALWRYKKMYSRVLGHHTLRCLACPRCNHTVSHRDAMASPSDVVNYMLKCKAMVCPACRKVHGNDTSECASCSNALVQCKEPLYQPDMHKVAPAHYVKTKKIRADYFIRDEAHLSKSATSEDGIACATLAAAAKYRLILTGTLLAGKSEDLRPLLFRLMPRSFIRMGYGWRSEIDFATAYGRIQTVVKSSGPQDGVRRKRGKGSNRSTSRSVKPGIMPHLYPHFVANHTAFMSLPDLVSDLPPYIEETVGVHMGPSMKAEYKEMQDAFADAFRELRSKDKRMAAKLLGPMLETLMTWPDVPYGRDPVIVEGRCICIPPHLDRTATYPKEQRLLEYVAAEKAAGRKCMIFSDRDCTQERIKGLLESHGYSVAHLRASVDPRDRIEWLARHSPANQVGLCNPTLVETGMELFGPGYNYPTLLWYSTGWRLNTLRQASRRSWRIGQKESCKTVYFYYHESAQQKAIALMASKLVAAEALEGKFSDGGLADEAVDEDIAMEIARTLADGIEIKMQEKTRPVEAAASQPDRVSVLRKRLAKWKQLRGIA